MLKRQSEEDPVVEGLRRLGDVMWPPVIWPWDWIFVLTIITVVVLALRWW